MSVTFVDIDRFWSKVAFGDWLDCWLWTGKIDHKGYGEYARRWGKAGTSRERRISLRAHRVTYELIVDPIPVGLQLDHLCRVRHCVNPMHLEPVTAAENTRRSAISPTAINGRKTHCKWGHPFDELNTYVYPATGYRQCRACVARRSAA